MAYTFNTLFTATTFTTPTDLWIYTNDGQPPMPIAQVNKAELVELPVANGNYRDDWNITDTGMTMGTGYADDGVAVSGATLKARMIDTVMHIIPRVAQVYRTHWQWTIATTGAVVHCDCRRFVRSSNVAPDFDSAT